MQLLAFAENNTATVQVVRGKFNLYAVTRNDADVVFAHLAAQMGKDNVLILQFNTEHGVRKGFFYNTFNFYSVIFISHKFLQNLFAFC